MLVRLPDTFRLGSWHRQPSVSTAPVPRPVLGSLGKQGTSLLDGGPRTGIDRIYWPKGIFSLPSSPASCIEDSFDRVSNCSSIRVARGCLGMVSAFA
ncbi:hypothetical protein K505DRAFT_17993 [Melanomma pulvis-pyrius CBS 109.77]|uniref:Uncharacterized protein n=1 Tax=Melanomma pulvis-pyrius CBS 109.77 TaxID=1314802 RepID=A0A6A6XHM4_9PLEO|nr:hypothetical protein K505DRAFT_17993 [Melanomma pulvis-pyrius CBS 109.77]